MLNKKQLSLIPRSFDIVGDILIFSDFPKELEKKEKEVGEYLLKRFKNIKVVARKTKIHSGKYRLKKVKIIAGENRKITTHKENGCLFSLNIEKCYFSPRLSNERLRIANLVKKNENILVMFSGVAIYPIIITKKSKSKEIFAIEINPTAYKYALENLTLNKLTNIKLFRGDVTKVLPRINKKFDRIIMPLPKGAQNYLDLATKKLNKKGTIHLYIFLKQEEIDKKKLAKKFKKFKILKIVKCGQFSPSVFRVCIDLKLR